MCYIRSIIPDIKLVELAYEYKYISGKETNTTMKKNNLSLIFLCMFFTILIILRRAWISDDAYITLRTVDNFVNGYGLTWNVAERVQTYTHPLWMFLLSIFYFITREPFYTTILISLLTTGIAIYLLLKKIAVKQLVIILASLILGLSRAFVDYSTSGLENPLSHLIIVIFYVYFFTERDAFTKKDMTYLSLIASFGLINRMDLILVFIAPLAYELIRSRKWKYLLSILVGQIPFLIWEMFSLIYYGYFIPNTAYAKLPNGIFRSVILRQGFTYFLNLLTNDPLTFLIIFIGLLLPLLNKENKKGIITSLGISLYLLYILWVGGDFMSGRFFTVPLFLAVINIAINSSVFSKKGLYTLICITLILGLSIPYHTLTINIPEIDNEPSGIDDERIYFYPGMSLITRYRNHLQPDYEWKTQGEEFRETDIKVTHALAIGMFGYYSGPDIHIIDGMGLTDPLISKLPSSYDSYFRPGHVVRDFPEGYRQSIEESKNLIEDPELKEYYEKVLIITRGNIFAWDRIKTIFEMNFGKYDYLLK